MPSPAKPFHVGQQAAIRASAAVVAAMGQADPRVFVAVPTNAKPPYVKIGEDDVDYDASGCGGEGEIIATVSVWSRPDPPQGSSARDIGAALVAALAVPFAIDGHTIDVAELEGETYATDPDHSTRARLVFRYLTTEQVA